MLPYNILVGKKGTDFIVILSDTPHDKISILNELLMNFNNVFALMC